MTRSPFAPLLTYFGGLTVACLIAVAFADRPVPALWLGLTLLASYSVAASALWLFSRAVRALEEAEKVPEEKKERPIRLAA